MNDNATTKAGTPRKRPPRPGEGAPAIPYTPEICNIVDTVDDPATIDQIAAVLGICRNQVYDWMNEYPEFMDAVKNRREAADDGVECAVYDQAVGRNGSKKHILAGMYWLNNRRYAQWSQKQDIQISGDISYERKDYSIAPAPAQGQLHEANTDESKAMIPQTSVQNDEIEEIEVIDDTHDS